MQKKERQRVLTAFRLTTGCFAGLGVFMIVALVLLVVLIVKNPADRAAIGKVQQATGQASQVAEASQNLTNRLLSSGRAVINDAYRQDDAMAVAYANVSDTEFLSVYWLENGLIKQADPTSPAITISNGQCYNFTLTVQVNREAAQNVRAFVRMPRSLQPSETAQVEVLVTADNATPYYETIELIASSDLAISGDSTSTDTTTTDAASGETATVDSDKSVLQLNYREDSVVLRSNSLVDGTKLDAWTLFAGKDGVLLGANEMDGNIPTGEKHAAILSWTIDVSAGEDSASFVKKESAAANESHVETLWDLYQQSLEASKP